MNRYEAPMPRVSFGLAAIALSVVTFAMTVMLPASLESARGGNAPLAAAKPAAIEVSIIPARIVVTGECEQNMAYEPAPRVTPVIDRSS